MGGRVARHGEPGGAIELSYWSRRLQMPVRPC
jgi:hypothetical protein